MQDTIVEKTEQTLEQRIASAISSPPASSEALLSLIVDINVAVDTADTEAGILREQSLNPAILDGEAAHERADTSMFRSNRLHRSLDAIQALHDEALAREQATAWRSSFDRIRIERDHLAYQFASRYAAITDELVTLFKSIAQVDQQIDSLHATSPDGEWMRLRKVEASARGIEVVDPNDSIIEKCKLPTFAAGPSYGSPLAWPPEVGPDRLRCA